MNKTAMTVILISSVNSLIGFKFVKLMKTKSNNHRMIMTYQLRRKNILTIIITLSVVHIA
jgi:hypothetical protein